MQNKAKKLQVYLIGIFLIFIASCHKKASFPNCRKDEDCFIDSYHKKTVCYMGKCEECAQDKDCQSHERCINNKCKTPCQVDADCDATSHCEENYCVKNCIDDSNCLEDQICDQGRCVNKVSENILN